MSARFLADKKGGQFNVRSPYVMDNANRGGGRPDCPHDQPETIADAANVSPHRTGKSLARVEPPPDANGTSPSKVTAQ